MSHPLADELLAAVDSLPYPQRVRRFAQQARALTISGGLDELLRQLSSGDEFRREVGLLLAEVSGRADVIASFVDDSDWRLRERALVALTRSGRLDAAALAGLLARAPARTRRELYRALRSGRQADLADALVDAVRAEFGDAEAVALLPACGAATVAGLLAELGHQVGNWATLARRHPEAVLGEAARQLAALAEPGRDAWWGRHGDGVLAVAHWRPYAVLDLLERFAPAVRLPGSLRAYGRLAAAEPGRVLALLTAPGRAAWLRRVRLPGALLRRFGRLEPAALHGLARGLRDDEHRLAALLERLPPSRRVELYDAAQAGVSQTTAQLSSTLLDTLPHSRRIAEARRILGLRAVRDNEWITVCYTAHLPWAEAEPVLAAATGRGEPEERARAWVAMVECAARTGPDAVTAVVSRMRRLRNEQDPVRSRALAALSRVRPSLIEPDTAETLQQLATEAVQAQDSSSATVRAVSDLAVSVLREHFDVAPLLGFAQQALQLIYGSNDRMPYLAPLHTRLRRGQEVSFLAAVTPWLRAGIEHGRYEALFSVAQALGRRAWGLVELQAMLEQAIHRANVSTAVRRAIVLWLADPSRRSARVEEVLRFDPSAVALPEVWAVLVRHRTDLLDAVLTGRGPQGRFLADGVRWVPPFAGHVRRWLPRQRKSYVDLLARIVGDAGVVGHARASAIAAAARAGESGLALVRRYVDSPDVQLAEAALGSLVWTDDPAQALPLLLTYVDTDRARVATYAAGRAAAFAGPDRLRDLLAPIATGTGKVTSRKEALRLLGRFGGRAAGSLLLAAWSRPDQHRDVRAAVVSVARQRLDSDGAWQVLGEAAVGDRYDVRALVRADPLVVPAGDRHRYAALVVRACTHEDREAARSAWPSLPVWTQWTDDLTALLAGQLCDLEDTSLWLSAISTLVALAGQGGGGNELLGSVDALLALDGDDPTSDDPSLDRPAHRRLTSLVEALLDWSLRVPPDAPRAALSRAGRRLLEDPARRYLGARLLVHAIAADGLPEVCDLLLAEPVAVLGVQEVSDELARRVEEHPADPAPVLATAVRLAARGDLPGGLLALALARRGEELGWPVQWRELVHGLRRHPSADVRVAALRLDLAASEHPW